MAAGPDKEYRTRFGSFGDYDKGGVDVIDDDPGHYAFSNIFEVANDSSPWEKVAVGKNQEYVLEVVRAEGTSQWSTAAHDEFALVLDGELTTELVKLDQPVAEQHSTGSITIDGDPVGPRMGEVIARQGHMVLLPANSAYRMSAPQPCVVLLQTIAGPETIERWSQICQTA